MFEPSTAAAAIPDPNDSKLAARAVKTIARSKPIAFQIAGARCQAFVSCVLTKLSYRGQISSQLATALHASLDRKGKTGRTMMRTLTHHAPASQSAVLHGVAGKEWLQICRP